MDPFRNVERIIKGQLTSDGAGVRLRRIFGFNQEGLFDPFLLLDFFGSDKPEEYMAGFPSHPHRGMETVTYMLEGKVEHSDSMGNKGIIGKGDIQWMTAGSGIIHQEMPQSDAKRMFGFQLWLNLPASKKMMSPRYQDIKAKDIPELVLDNKIKLRIIAGEFNGTKGPVEDLIADPIYFDISIPAGNEFVIDVHKGYTVFALVFEGEAYFDESKNEKIKFSECALFDDGNKVKVTADKENVRFLLISGKPIKEPIAWGGPIVMNTEEELALAFKEFRDGTFVK